MSCIDISAMKDSFTMTVILYPESYESLDTLFGDIRENVRKSDGVILADDSNEKLFLSLMKEIGNEYDVKSPSTTFSTLLELAKERLMQKKEGL